MEVIIRVNYYYYSVLSAAFILSISHCYTILPHHLSIFLVFLFCLIPSLFQTPPVSAICHLAFMTEEIQLLFPH